MSESENPSKLQISRKEAINKLWQLGHLYWKLNPAQISIYEALKANENKIQVVSAARRFGKTFILTIMAFEACLQKPGCVVKFVAPEAKMIRLIIKNIIREITVDCPKELRPEFSTQDSLYRFANGSELQLAGTDNGNADALRGGAATLCLVDEAGFCTDLSYVVRSVLLPTTSTTKGKVILASSPPRQAGHDFEEFKQEAEAQGNLLIKTVYDNPMIDQTELDAIIKSYPGGKDDVEFKREYECIFLVSQEDAVVPEFQAVEAEIVQEWQKPPFYDCYVGQDVGFKDLTFVVFGYYDFKNAKFVIEDEIVMSGKTMTTDKLAEAISKKEKELWTQPLTGEIKAPLDRVSDNNLILINDLYRIHGLRFTPADKDDMMASVNNLRMWVQQKRLVIHPRCKQLIAHLKNATWNKKRTSFTRSAAFGHYDACFTEDMTVITSKGVKQIKDVEVGDIVLTAKGNYKSVLKTHKIPYEGKLRHLKFAGRPPIKTTPDHKFWIAEGKRTTKFGLTGQVTIHSQGWKEAENIDEKQYHYGMSPVAEKETLSNPWSKELCFLIGYYVAEGSLGRNKTQVSFAGHKREKNVEKILLEAIVNTQGYRQNGSSRRQKDRLKKGLFKLKQTTLKTYYKKTGNGRVLSYSSKELANFLDSLKKGTEKCFPDISNLNSTQAFYMLSGYLFGDGNFTEGLVKANSISQHIAYGVEALALKCGVSLSSLRLQSREPQRSTSKGIDKNSKDQWQMAFNKEVSRAIIEKIDTHTDLRFVFEDKKIKYPEFKYYTNVPSQYHSIQSIEESYHSGYVYTLTVEDDASYTINGLAVKNCDALRYLLRSIRQNKNPYPPGYDFNHLSNEHTHFREDPKKSNITKQLEKIFSPKLFSGKKREFNK
jgi:hypothetical protein